MSIFVPLLSVYFFNCEGNYEKETDTENRRREPKGVYLAFEKRLFYIKRQMSHTKIHEFALMKELLYQHWHETDRSKCNMSIYSAIQTEDKAAVG